MGGRGAGLRRLTPQPPVRPETVLPSPLSQLAHCQEVTPGDASKPTRVGVAGTVK